MTECFPFFLSLSLSFMNVIFMPRLHKCLNTDNLFMGGIKILFGFSLKKENLEFLK